MNDIFGRPPMGPPVKLPGLAVNTADSPVPAGATSGAAGGAPATLNAPADVTGALDDGAKTKLEAGTEVKGNRNIPKYEPSPALKADIDAIKQAIAKKDYGAALKLMEKVNNLVGEKSPTGSDTAMQTVERQLRFLAQMQEKGIKADYPPTEKQLVGYFGKLKGDPAAARQAFEDYTQTFHAHSADVTGKPFGEDVVYKSTPKNVDGVETRSPDQWSDVVGRPAKGAAHVGKQMNDCEGFAFMAEKLLTAAGFTLIGHVDAKAQPPVPDHEMALFKHPKEKIYTVSSNNRTFTGSDAMSAARHGYAWAAGEREDPDTHTVVEKGAATGKETFYVGRTGAQAIANATNGTNPLK